MARKWNLVRNGNPIKYKVVYYSNEKNFINNRYSPGNIVADLTDEFIYGTTGSDIIYANNMNTLQTIMSGPGHDNIKISYKGVEAIGGSGNDKFEIGCYEELSCPTTRQIEDYNFFKAIATQNRQSEPEEPNRSCTILEGENNFYPRKNFPTVKSNEIHLNGMEGINSYHFKPDAECLPDNDLSYWDDAQIYISDNNQASSLHLDNFVVKMADNISPNKENKFEIKNIESIQNICFSKIENYNKPSDLSIKFRDDNNKIIGPEIILLKAYTNHIRKIYFSNGVIKLDDMPTDDDILNNCNGVIHSHDEL